MPLHSPYLLVATAPSPESFVDLRRAAGLTVKTIEQAQAGLPGSWAACHVTVGAEATPVGMGRVLGDGGSSFHIIDMAVDPAHQRRGLGDAMLTWLLDRIRAAAPGAYVSLGADEPGRGLYRRHGFVESAPDTIAMALSVPPDA